MKTIKIKELGIEVETEIHDEGKCLKDIKIKKGWRLLRIDEIIFLYNKYRKELNMEDTWEFFKQPFELNMKKGYASRFDAYPDYAYLGCDGLPQGSCSGLGVRFCRGIKMKTIKEHKLISDTMSRQVCWKAGYSPCKEDVLELIEKLQNDASKERKISKDKKYWLGCCQILNELKARIEG